LPSTASGPELSRHDGGHDHGRDHDAKCGEAATAQAEAVRLISKYRCTTSELLQMEGLFYLQSRRILPPSPESIGRR